MGLSTKQQTTQIFWVIVVQIIGFVYIKNSFAAVTKLDKFLALVYVVVPYFLIVLYFYYQYDYKAWKRSKKNVQ